MYGWYISCLRVEGDPRRWMWEPFWGKVTLQQSQTPRLLLAFHALRLWRLCETVWQMPKTFTGISLSRRTTVEHWFSLPFYEVFNGHCRAITESEQSTQIPTHSHWLFYQVGWGRGLCRDKGYGRRRLHLEKYNLQIRITSRDRHWQWIPIHFGQLQKILSRVEDRAQLFNSEVPPRERTSWSYQ